MNAHAVHFPLDSEPSLPSSRYISADAELPHRRTAAARKRKAQGGAGCSTAVIGWQDFESQTRTRR
jgi:hypothetical protein